MKRLMFWSNNKNSEGQLHDELKKVTGELREVKRKLELMGRAVDSNRDLQENETEFFEMAKVKMPYMSVISIGNGGVEYKFIFDSRDPHMIKHMWGGYKGVHSEIEMKQFFQLSEKYYGIKPAKDRVFCDIGGNIGTTSIYVKKQYPDLRVIAFEPERENCKNFRANCALNDCQIELRQMGLGNVMEKAELALNDENMGNHRIVNDTVKTRKKEKIIISTFDSEMEQLAEKIDFVWIDVEGYEGYVLDGMQGILKKKKFPIWMEFCPQMLEESGSINLLIKVIKQYFAGYVDRHDIKKFRTIDEINGLAQSLDNGRATDLFLVRKE